MRYLSVCSGIEAATVAWHPLGWSPVAFAEIDKFPSAVLQHHYPSVPNWGDITRFPEWPDAQFDVLVGGTPCQSFSVAGLRAGLADPRGNLALVFLGIADRYRPEWVVWENVPGVLSSTSHHAPDPCPPPPPLDLGCDGAEVDTEDEYESEEVHALQCLLAGFSELGYHGSWGVLDAQYFGLAQRRKRVFAIFHLGDWRRAAAVLFERESLSGHPAPRREAGEGSAVGAGVSAAVSSGRGWWDESDTGATIRAQDSVTKADTLIAHSLRADGFDASEDGTGRGTPLVPIPFGTTQMTSAANRSHPKAGDPCHPLAAGAHPPVIDFSAKDYGADAGEIAPTLRAGGFTNSHANGDVMPAVAFNWQSGGDARGLRAQAQAQALSRSQTPAMQHGMQVRRLTPRECERLQGFPDDYTLIPYRGKPAADGPRYKALGNSMAVPVMRWIGRRIQQVSEIP